MKSLSDSEIAERLRPIGNVDIVDGFTHSFHRLPVENALASAGFSGHFSTFQQALLRLGNPTPKSKPKT